MAELTLEACCLPETYASCCPPSAKAACCGDDRGDCGCDTAVQGMRRGDPKPEPAPTQPR